MRIRSVLSHSAQAIAEGALISLLVVGLIAGSALAAKGGNTGAGGGGGGHKSAGTTYTGSFSLVLLNSTDGQPHWGQKVTFNVSSNATYYFVAVTCSQSGATVYASTIGFYPAWPWSRTFYLQSTAWTGGAASCGAELYSSYSDGSNHQTLSSMTFDVAA